MKDEELIEAARKASEKAVAISPNKGDTKEFGAVGAAILSSHGTIYTGVSLVLDCGIGFCAEHSAVAEMIKNGETEIQKIVAITPEGILLPPCGRCRELIYQIDKKNLNTEVILKEGRKSKIKDLLPEIWQNEVRKN